MNNESNNDKQAPPAPVATPKPAESKASPSAKKTVKPKRNGAVATVFRLLVLLLVVGGLCAAGWYGWQWLVSEKTRHEAEISRLESELAELRDQTRGITGKLERARQELDSAQAALRDRMSVIAGDMDALREAARGGKRDLMRAEIEYLLRVAADELYLTQDVDTAIYALSAADDRLRQLAEPSLIPVRRLIADHLRELGAVNVPDITGMALQLGSLMREVSALPLRQSEHARAQDESETGADSGDASWWQRVRAGAARLFDKLVVVQRAEPPPPLLKPEEHFFLFRNVELQLAAARAALLAGDTAAYRQSLETAREWLNRYFDTADPAVARAIDDISALLEVSVQPALPDISPALQQFRELTGNTIRGARAE